MTLIRLNWGEHMQFLARKYRYGNICQAHGSTGTAGGPEYADTLERSRAESLRASSRDWAVRRQPSPATGHVRYSSQRHAPGSPAMTLFVGENTRAGNLSSPRRDSWYIKFVAPWRSGPLSTHQLPQHSCQKIFGEKLILQRDPSS